MLYFSIHRYEFGEFWPNLRQSDYDAVGEDAGRGYNINIPLNEVSDTSCLQDNNVLKYVMIHLALHEAKRQL